MNPSTIIFFGTALCQLALYLKVGDLPILFIGLGCFIVSGICYKD